MAENRLTRDTQEGMLGGVCAGIARHYDYDVTVVRVLWLLLTALSAGFGIVLYIVAWIVMPPGGATVTGSAGPAADIGDEVMNVGERIAESARVVARATREATEEIAEIARGRPTATQHADTTEAEEAGAIPTERPPVDPSGPRAASGAGDEVTDESAESSESAEEAQERTPSDEPGAGDDSRRDGGGTPPAAPV